MTDDVQYFTGTPCSRGPGGSGGSTVQGRFLYQYYQVNVYYDDASVVTSIAAGFDGRNNAFSRTRLGYFADAAFDASGVGTGTETVNAQKTLSFTINAEHATSVEAISKTDSFTVFDGDLTPTDSAGDKIAWRDRIAFVACIGSSIGSVTYNPRADFDLNGTVDLSDYAAFLVVFNAKACTADYDSNGVVETADIFAFLNDYFASSLNADFNGNWMLDTGDVLDFLNAMSNPC